MQAAAPLEQRLFLMTILLSSAHQIHETLYTIIEFGNEADLQF